MDAAAAIGSPPMPGSPLAAPSSRGSGGGGGSLSRISVSGTPAEPDAMRQRFAAAWAAAGLAGLGDAARDGVWREVLQALNAPGRHFHNFARVAGMLEWLRRAGKAGLALREPGAVELAVFLFMVAFEPEDGGGVGIAPPSSGDSSSSGGAAAGGGGGSGGGGSRGGGASPPASPSPSAAAAAAARLLQQQQEQGQSLSPRALAAAGAAANACSTPTQQQQQQQQQPGTPRTPGGS